MWTGIVLTNFKCFTGTRLRLKPLALLSGINGSGKSTLLQGPVLLRQTVIENDWSDGIHLNGGSVSLGTLEDVVKHGAEPKTFAIELANEIASCRWIAGGSEHPRDLVADLQKVIFTPVKGPSTTWSRPEPQSPADAPAQAVFRLMPMDWHSNIPQARHFAEAICRIQYISAERLGPRETYQLTARTAFPSVGAKGEFTADFLNTQGRRNANLALTSADDPQQVLASVRTWMDEFFPGFAFSIDPIQGTSLVVLRFSTTGGRSNHRTQNVGYGLTHALPIITACVGSRAGDTIIVENPEAHLHPQAQSQMGEFLARTASSGVQVIVESHSDHVLNGMRKAIHKTYLPPDDAVFNFVAPADGPQPEIVESSCDANGRIMPWPQKFFDQFETDLLELP